MDSDPKLWLLLDWGDTLMRVLPGSSGPMHAWPHVEALPGSLETLSSLRKECGLALATNAADSDEAEIRLALERAGLGTVIDRVFCYHFIGYRKPAPEFFTFILEDLDIAAGQAVMVGDDFEVDVLGANRSGLRAIWLNELTDESRSGSMFRTIHSLQELPNVLVELTGVSL